MITVSITTDTTPESLRALLATETVADTDRRIIVSYDDNLRFTHLRSCLAVVNAAAFARSCQLRYSNEREFYDPPLTAHYSHEPHIHANTFTQKSSKK